MAKAQINLEKIKAATLPFLAPEKYHEVPGFKFLKEHINEAPRAHFGVSHLDKPGNPFYDGVDPDSGTLASFPPQQFLTRDQKLAFQNADWNAINQLKAVAASDLQPDNLFDLSKVWANIKDNGDKSFVNVESGGQIFAVSYSDKATYWIWPQKLQKDHPAAQNLQEDRVAYHVSLGSYSSSAGFVGVSSYVLTNVPLQLVATALTGVFSKLLQNLIQRGLTWAFSVVASRLSVFLAEAGWESAAIVLTETAISRIAWVIAGPLSALVYLVINWLFSVLFKEYALVIDAYNFDPDSDWTTSDYAYLDNAIVSGGGAYKGLNVPKYIPPDSSITPPGFQPIKNQEGVIGYFSYTLVNDSKFLQGLGIALEFNRSSDLAKFQAKYDLRRVENNRLGVKDGGGDLGDYFKNQGWDSGKTGSTKTAGLDVSIR